MVTVSLDKQVDELCVIVNIEEVHAVIDRQCKDVRCGSASRTSAMH